MKIQQLFSDRSRDRSFIVPDVWMPGQALAAFELRGDLQENQCAVQMGPKKHV